MGCFSYHCKECGQNIREGEGVKLFLLHEGKVLEEMEGNYTTYGNVDEHDWKNNWGKINNLQFDNFDDNGIAAVHSDCFTGQVPTTASRDDEQQGCGKPKHKPAKTSSTNFYAKIVKSDRDRERDEKLKKLSEGLSGAVDRAYALLEELKAHNNSKK